MPLLFAYGINKFSQDGVHLELYNRTLCLPFDCMQTIISYFSILPTVVLCIVIYINDHNYMYQ